MAGPVIALLAGFLLTSAGKKKNVHFRRPTGGDASCGAELTTTPSMHEYKHEIWILVEHPKYVITKLQCFHWESKQQMRSEKLPD